MYSSSPRLSLLNSGRCVCALTHRYWSGEIVPLAVSFSSMALCPSRRVVPMTRHWPWPISRAMSGGLYMSAPGVISLISGGWWMVVLDHVPLGVSVGPYPQPPPGDRHTIVSRMLTGVAKGLALVGAGGMA